MASLFVQLSISVSKVVAISGHCVVDVRVCMQLQDFPIKLPDLDVW